MKTVIAKLWSSRLSTKFHLQKHAYLCIFTIYTHDCPYCYVKVCTLCTRNKKLIQFNRILQRNDKIKVALLDHLRKNKLKKKYDKTFKKGGIPN